MSETSTVIIPTGDAQIWHKDEAIVALAKAMASNHKIELDCITEGPCLETAELYKTLDLLCESFNYDKDKIVIKNICNQIEQHTEYRVEISPPMKHVEKLQKDLKETLVEYKTFSADTKHFGNFTSRSSRNRLIIGSYLYTKYKNKTLQTYHCNINDDYHKASIFLDDLMWSGAPKEIMDNAYNFLTRTTPIKFEEERVEAYPIKGFQMYGINAAYPKIFVDIVCQTYCQGRTFYLDEKMWRPIMTKTPFIVQGSQNFISNLNKLGFKSFNKWWNEDYSYKAWNQQAYDILKIVDELSNLPIEQISNIYNEMKPVLDYNYEKFLNLSARDFEVFKK